MSMRCVRLSPALLFAFLVMLCAVLSCGTEDAADTAVEQRIIPFSVWLREASLDRDTYDAFAFVMDGTCGACQMSLDSAALNSQRSVIYVSSDFATAQRYLRRGMSVYYDSTGRMQHLDILHHKTVVVFLDDETLKEEAIVLEPSTLAAILHRL